VIEVLATGPSTTVQDLGRVGYAAWGVGSGGAADRGSLRLGNRLVGNPESAAGFEILLGQAELRFTDPALVAVTGAPAPVSVDGRPGSLDGPQWLAAGSVLRLGRPPVGLRSYVTVRGGLDTVPLLGSRSVDVRGGIGRPLRAGDRVPIGAVTAAEPIVELAPRPAWPSGPITLSGLLGPHDDWFTADALRRLVTARFVVDAASDRIGLRLRGPVLERVDPAAELVSEPTMRGAVEVPPDGQPIVFGPDHPTVIGYPVLAVLDPASADQAAQCRPGQVVTFSLTRSSAQPD
jgi:biotin-dependent carboxylase-like uncharacterized protein